MYDKLRLYYDNNKKIICWLITVVCSIITIGMNTYIVYHAMHSELYDFYLGRTIYRCLFFTMIMGIVFLHIWIPWKRLYQFVFKYRLLIAIAIIIFMVVNGLHFSSITIYDEEIQPGQGSEFRIPILGNPQPIRSDEWYVSTPAKLSTQFAGTSDRNYIPMAMEMDNIVASGLQFGWSMLAKPYEWGYYTGNAVIGISFQWSFTLVFTFLASFEFCLILSGRKRWVGFLGACLITFSAYNMWWSYAIWIFAGMSAIVCFCYAIQVSKWWQRLLYGISTAISAACFVVNLYPAWQVPAGYMLLICLVWAIIHYRKKLSKLNAKNWGILVGCILFMVSIIVTYLNDYSAYTTMIMNTVYPGERISNGGMSLYKICNYIGSWFFPYRAVENASESATILCLFPIPLLLGILHIFRSKKKDILIIALTVLSVFLTLYCSVGIPMWLSKATLMSHSTPERAADILAMTQLILLLVYIGREKEQYKLTFWTGLILSRAVLLITAYGFTRNFPGYLRAGELIIIIDVLTVCSMILISRHKLLWKKQVAVILSIVSIITGLSVHPLTKGLDAIYSKPLAKEIMQITKEDPYGKWLAVALSHADGYLIACGAPTINSTNFVPNYEMWEILDPDGVYEECWNRYAHINVGVVQHDTCVDLIRQDNIWLRINYNDLESIGVSYIYSEIEIPSYDGVVMEEIYCDGEIRIYKVVYE